MTRGTSNKQERAAKARKRGAAKAEAIIAETVAAVTSKEDYTSDRLPTATDADYEAGVAVRQARDAGVPWWAIARDLGLPGAGSSAQTGKRGAGKARALYAKAFGKHPASFVRGAKKGLGEQNEHVKAVQQVAKVTQRKAIVQQGKAVIDLTLTDEELIEMVRGRKIAWSGVSEALQCTIEGEATVHPKVGLRIEGEGATRVLHFREQHNGAPLALRLHPAHMRTVRMANIYSIK